MKLKLTFAFIITTLLAYSICACGTNPNTKPDQSKPAFDPAKITAIAVPAIKFITPTLINITLDKSADKSKTSQLWTDIAHAIDDSLIPLVTNKQPSAPIINDWIKTFNNKYTADPLIINGFQLIIDVIFGFIPVDIIDKSISDNKVANDIRSVLVPCFKAFSVAISDYLLKPKTT